MPIAAFSASTGRTAAKAKRALASGDSRLADARSWTWAAASGQKTIPVADALPGSEVHRIDLSAPMIQDTRIQRAERMGRRVHFSQQNAERTKFPDESFDLVFSTIRDHELPPGAI